MVKNLLSLFNRKLNMPKNLLNIRHTIIIVIMIFKGE